jgi:ribosomal protein S18 acetylase RimI-like enzyme
MPMDDTNLSTSRRQATLTDSDLAYQVKKLALGEYVKQTYGGWDEAFQRRFHDRRWAPAGTQIVAVKGMDVGWVWCTHHADHISVDGIYILPQHQGHGIGTYLLSCLRSEAVSVGKAVQLWVMKRNPAFEFYKRVGFSVIGETETHWHMEAKA